MSSILICCVFLCTFLMPEASCSIGQCRHLEFRAAQALKGTRLINHVIHIADVTDESSCRILCFEDHSCVSYNFMTRSEAGKHKCELNNSTHEEHENDLEENSNYAYHGAKNACVSNQCKNNATCQTGFTDRGYRCLCIPGFTGQDCENALSCKELYDRKLSSVNKAYQMKVGSENILVYCHLNGTDLGACGEGGWTLVMKIDGTQTTFRYDSILWTNKETLNLAGGETGFDTHETKLPTYWNTPFSKICLGMKIHGEEATSFIVINKTADSMYSLIADGQFRATSLGRDTWKALLGSQGSLQLNCYMEGFNADSDYFHSKARIGILGNDQNDCSSCDSRIGFGTGGYPDNTNTCGNVAQHGGDNGEKHMKTMGYILVQ